MTFARDKGKALTETISSQLLTEAAIAADRLFGFDWSVRLSERISGFNDNHHRFDQSKWSFCRVPKTGSTSVSWMLKLLAYDRCVNLDSHVGVSRECPPGPYRYFTFLRDPVDRVWSHYQMVKRFGGRSGWAIHVRKGFEHYCSRCWEAQNMMTRYLVARARKPVGPQHVDQALENLSRFAFVGFFDSLQADALALLEALGRPTPHVTLPHETRAAVPKETVTDEHREVARHYNALDVELVRLARQQHRSE